MNNVKKLFLMFSTILMILSIFVPGIQAVAETEDSTNNGKNFKDIQKHWAQKQIEELVEMGIIQGYEDGTFRPEKEVTRAQFVSMAVRLLGIKADGSAESFRDVPATHWAYSAIEAALEQKIIDPQQNFYPGKAITREEMAVIIAKALELKPADEDKLGFKDQKDIKNNPRLVAAAIQAGFINGYGDKTFRPKEKLTRAQSTVVLMNMYNYLEGLFFRDIESYRGKEAIHSLVDLGIIFGYEDNSFRPNNHVTRGQFVAMIIRMMGYEAQSADSYFKDVGSSHWAFNSVQAAVENGVIIPEDYNGKLSPEEKLSRQEMAIIMVRTLKLTPLEEADLKFKDKKDITKGAGLIAKAVNEGLISGHDDQTFRPADSSTRGQAAMILYRLYNYSIESENPEVPTPLLNSKEEDEIKLLDAVHEMPETLLESLVEVKDDNSTFVFQKIPEELKGLKAGDIFVLPPSETDVEGYAEKVKSITIVNGNTVIKTEDPEFTEVFKEVDIQAVTDISFDEMIPIEVPEGVTFNPVGLKNGTDVGIASEEDYGFKIEMKEREISIDGTTVKLSGKIEFRDPKLVTKVDYGFGKLKYLKSVFKTDPTISVDLGVDKEVASGSAKSKDFKGIELDSNIPSFVKKTKSTEPFDEKKLLGRYFIPVAGGPAGANIEIFLHLRADLTVGFSVNVVEVIEMEAGFAAEKGSLTPVRKVEFLKPDLVVSGKGGVQAKAGAGLGLKVAIYRLSIGGLEGETGLYAGAYANALLSYGDAANPDNKGNSTSFDICYRADAGAFGEMRATFDILKVLGIDAQINIFEKEKPFASATNCEEDMLVAKPSYLMLTPGESKEIDLEYYSFSKEKLELTDLTEEVDAEDVSFELGGDKEIKVKQSNADGKHSFVVEADSAAIGGEIGELKFIYNKGSKKIKQSVKIFITSFEGIEVSPESMVLDANESKKLSVKAKYKEIAGLDYKELLKDGMKKEDLFTRQIDDSDQVSFKSLDSSIATVDNKGMVTGKSLVQDSKTQIEVSYRGKKATIPIAVRSKAYTGGGSSGGSGESPANPRLEMFRLIILDSEKNADAAFRPEAVSHYPADFENLKPMLEDFYTDNYLNEQWKKVYQNNIKWFSDPHLLYPLTEATKIGTGNTFTLIRDNANKVTASVAVPLRDNEIKGDRFKYEYTLTKENDRWRLDDITCTNCERPEDKD